jgi:hypothetical protein
MISSNGIDREVKFDDGRYQQLLHHGMHAQSSAIRDLSP